MRRIYLDYASLTPIDPRLLREIKRYSGTEYANPSSLYKEGVAARNVLASSRKTVADAVRALPDEIIFTSGGTEANALALEGVVRAARARGLTKPHLIISTIEHSSVIETAAMLERNGVEVTRIPVDMYGVVSPEEVKKALRPETILVSVMHVNNEIGTIQPIREIAKMVRHARKTFHGDTTDQSRYPLFHTDAAQAPLYLEIGVEKLGVDMLTLDSAKIYGPRGMGCLYIKRGTPIEPIMYGGGQEKGLRSGSENIPSIAGFTKAMEMALKDKDKEVQRREELKSFFIAELHKIRADIQINPATTQVDPDRRGTGSFVPEIVKQAPHILNVSIPGIDNEFFLFQLDAHGVSISTKSSCLRDEDESYVLKAIGANNKT